MKKKIFSIFMTLLLIMSACSVAFANDTDTPGSPNRPDTPMPTSNDDDDNENDPRATDSMTFGINRTSGTTASATVRVSYNTTVDQCNVVVYLQKLADGQWVTDSSHADSVIYNSDMKVRSFTFTHTYKKLTYGATYRLKVVSKDYINGNDTTMVGYSNSF